MRHSRIHLLCLFTLLLLITGCQGLPTLTQGDEERSLEQTLRAYGATVRWGYPGQAYNFLHPDLAEPSPLPDSLQNIRITGYQVIRPPTKVADGTVNQTVVIGYIFIDRQVEHSVTDQQRWEYDKDTNSWSRINPLPELK